MSWLTKIKDFGLTNTSKRKDSKVPSGLWMQCPQCQATLYGPDLIKKMNICSKCGNHLQITARERLELFLDEEGREELGKDLVSSDILNFSDLKKYKDRLSAASKKTGEKEALLAMSGSLKSIPVVCAAFEFDYMGGSMGRIVGEKFQICADYAEEKVCPFVCFSASGGARMQEGLISLLQMAKTSAAVEKLKQKSIPYISVLTNPTYGGVTASLAMLGDIIIAEPGAAIGFAGKRVIEQTVRETLPEGFQTSEFLLENGAIDMVVKRTDMRNKVYSLITLLR